MTTNRKTMTLRHALLESFNRLILEFGDFAATCANEMIVMFPGSNIFVTFLAVAKIELPGDPGLRKKLQGAANSSVTDTGMLRPYFPVEFLGAHMPGRGKK